MNRHVHGSLAGALVLAALAASASAAPVQPNIIIKGWVWANQPSAAAYTPSPTYQYNLRTEILPAWPFRDFSSASNTVARTGIGAYAVTFTGLAADGGTVHVTAYGGSHHCKVAGWTPSGADMLVNVRCYSPAGAASDGMFTALLYKDGTKSTIYGNAYLWADQQATVGCYTPSPDYQFNSRGGTNTVCRISGGEYTVQFPAMTRDRLEANKGGHVQVTAYGSNPARCKVRGWSELAGTVTARIGCYLGGAPADSQFTATFLREAGELAMSVAEETNEDFYVWADTAPAPSAFYQTDSYGGGGATLEGPTTGLPAGTYRVHLPGVNPSGSTAMVTAYGSGAAHCTVTSWSSDPAISGTQVNVRCFDGGIPVNAQFTLLYLTDQLILF